MMEFLTSRVALVICGAIILGTVAIPMCQTITDEGDGRIQDVADGDARAIDRFYDSVLDVMYLEGCRMLPSASYSMTLDGYMLTITDSQGGRHSAAMAHPCGYTVLSYGDSVKLVKEDGIIMPRTSLLPS